MTIKTLEEFLGNPFSNELQKMKKLVALFIFN